MSFELVWVQKNPVLDRAMGWMRGRLLPGKLPELLDDTPVIHVRVDPEHDTGNLLSLTGHSAPLCGVLFDRHRRVDLSGA
jgi:hypothetical protein